MLYYDKVAISQGINFIKKDASKECDINVSINKIIASSKVPFGRKGFNYFIGYKDDRKIRPSFIMVLNMKAC